VATVATGADAAHSVALAHDLATSFMTSARSRPGAGPSGGSGRGGLLPDHDAWVQACLDRSRSLLDVEPPRRLWARLRTVPPSPGGHVMTHGDLIPGTGAPAP
jgi:hypothetical protein